MTDARPDSASVRAELFEALKPRDGIEANALIEAVDLYIAYCLRFGGGPRDRRFSMLDATPVDQQAFKALRDVHARIVAVLGKFFDARGISVPVLTTDDPKRTLEILRERRFDLSDDDVTPIVRPPTKDGKP
ncbi:MAG TPA: hypothetical protein VMN56_05670 [Casimicrobiaceae bacterium]|nr:hypothetical protein [Casimicrobiaceae bacterium]